MLEIIQQEFKNHLEKISFYQAIELFENQKNLSKSYQLFIKCALTGNICALPYINYFHQNYYHQIFIENNIITKYLDYWILNIPIIAQINPRHWMNVSLIKIKIKNFLINPEEEKEQIIDQLLYMAKECSLAYILLQDIIIGKYVNFNINSNLKLPCPLHIDLFLIAYINFEHQIHSNLQNIINNYHFVLISKLCKRIVLNNYQFHGKLEKEISMINDKCNHYEFKIRWLKTAALMGNYNLCDFLINSDNDLNKIRIILFSGLAGNILYKSIIAISLCYFNHSKLEIATSVQSSQNIPQELINLSLGNQWIMNLAKIPIPTFISQVIKFHNNLEIINNIITTIYLYAAKIMEITYFEPNTESTPDLKTIFNYYYKVLEQNNYLAIYNLINLNYRLENYTAAANWLNYAITKKMNLYYNEVIPIIHAKMIKFGLGGMTTDQITAGKTIITAAKFDNDFAKLEIILSIIQADQVINSLLSHAEIAQIANNLYLSHENEIFTNQEIVTILIIFYSLKEYADSKKVKQLIIYGLKNNYPLIMFIFAEYNLFGNDFLKIKKDPKIALNYYRQILDTDHYIIIHNKKNILNAIGIALIRCSDHKFYLELAEKYLIQAYNATIAYAEYNLACLYIKMSQNTKALNLLDLAFLYYSEDPDILEDLGVLYLSDLQNEVELEMALELLSKSFELGNNRVIPIYILINVCELLINQTLPSKEQLSYYKNLLLFYATLEEMQQLPNEAKSIVHLLEASINLIYQPHQSTIVLEKLKNLNLNDPKIKFAIKYLELKMNEQDLGCDLFLILNANKCRSTEEIEYKFKDLQIKLNIFSQNKELNNHDRFGYNYYLQDNLYSRFNKLNFKLQSFFDKEQTAKLNYNDFKGLFAKYSKVFAIKEPGKIMPTFNHLNWKISINTIDLYYQKLTALEPNNYFYEVNFFSNKPYSLDLLLPDLDHKKSKKPLYSYKNKLRV